MIICLISARLLQEYLVAASQLKMTDGRFVFVGVELDMKAAHNRQSLSFKWSTTGFSDDSGKSKSKF